MPLQHDFILVKMFEPEEKTKGGLFLPMSSPTPFREGRVLESGPGTYNNGTLIEVSIIPGDVVTFHNGAGATYKDGNRLIKYSDVIEVQQAEI